MATLLEIETAIKQLAEDDLRQLFHWLQDYLDGLWDRQIEADLSSGNLDELMAKAESVIAAGEVRGLDEVLHHS
ncbi:hypothetical protein VB780_02385 [Leptolyngbya sp. CCNP1308]|uniref:hypothetical protein n=1 Tax=Leptolyngbya sp. CCNP1308 TaxID=3110255 RepID=UPI002B219856|nr:hypothetical protein [Leptolyngbya sp. CCNP1308]MEA5447400.1 hypothetical protein [Leptolyngbya sp. CCNP1308]